MVVLLFTLQCAFVLHAGGSSKTLMVVNICPNMLSMSETLSSLNFAARARNAMLSLGNRDTIKKWKDVVSLLNIIRRGKDRYMLAFFILVIQLDRDEGTCKLQHKHVF